MPMSFRFIFETRYLSDVNQYGQHYLYTSQDNVFWR